MSKHTERLESKRRARHERISSDMSFSILIAGICFAITAGSLYFGLVHGWDSIIPGKGGGMTAQVALGIAFALDSIGALLIYVTHKKVTPRKRPQR